MRELLYFEESCDWGVSFACREIAVRERRKERNGRYADVELELTARRICTYFRSDSTIPNNLVRLIIHMWCRILSVADTKANHFWSSLSKKLIRLSPALKKKAPTTTSDTKMSAWLTRHSPSDYNRSSSTSHYMKIFKHWIDSWIMKPSFNAIYVCCQKNEKMLWQVLSNTLNET